MRSAALDPLGACKSDVRGVRKPQYKGKAPLFCVKEFGAPVMRCRRASWVGCLSVWHRGAVATRIITRCIVRGVEGRMIG